MLTENDFRAIVTKASVDKATLEEVNAAWQYGAETIRSLGQRIAAVADGNPVANWDDWCAMNAARGELDVIEHQLGYLRGWWVRNADGNRDA